MTEWYEWAEAPPADFAVIGDPISHSLSPRMWQAAFSETGLDLRYVALRVPAGKVEPALLHLDGLGYQAVNVTVPLKAEACLACASLEDFARRSAAVNAILLKGRVGRNTDGPGFLDTLSDLPVRGRNVLLLGAGGSARSVALALASEGYNLRVFNRTRVRAEEMVRDLQIDAKVVDAPALLDAHLIVNATSASLTGSPVPVRFEEAAPGTVAYDLVYGDTPFLKSAREHGLLGVDGRALLVAQGARAFAWWLHRDPPRAAMEAGLG